MKFDPGSVTEQDTRGIINILIDHVTKTDEEAAEEARNHSKSTELKVFIAESRGLQLGNISQRLEELYQSEHLTQYGRDFIDQHTFSEEKLNEDVSYLEIGTPQYGRTDQFILLNEDGYLRALSAERRTWTERTVEKLIQYLPELDRLYLSPADVEGMVTEEIEASVSGFTAKYSPYYSDKKLSIQFHGGERDDLEDIEEQFHARPSRVEFDQKEHIDNGVETVVKGAVRQDGYYSIPQVRRGSGQTGYEIIKALAQGYENHDREHFKVDQRPRDSFKDGFTIQGATTLRLVEENPGTPDQGVTTDGGDSSLAELLEEEILDSKRRYKYSVWEPGDFLVFDTETREPFQIAVEDDDLAIHAKPATTARSLRDFSHVILEEFNSTYSFEKVSKDLSA